MSHADKVIAALASAENELRQARTDVEALVVDELSDASITKTLAAARKRLAEAQGRHDELKAALPRARALDEQEANDAKTAEALRALDSVAESASRALEIGKKLDALASQFAATMGEFAGYRKQVAAHGRLIAHQLGGSEQDFSRPIPIASFEKAFVPVAMQLAEWPFEDQFDYLRESSAPSFAGLAQAQMNYINEVQQAWKGMK